MRGKAVHTLQDGSQVAVWQARLRDVVPYADGASDPLLWWAAVDRWRDAD